MNDRELIKTLTETIAALTGVLKTLTQPRIEINTDISRITGTAKSCSCVGDIPATTGGMCSYCGGSRNWNFTK